MARRIKEDIKDFIYLKLGEIMKTPISDKHNLSLESTKEPTVDGFSQWSYEIGLMLDGVIPLKGASNPQRIEMAIEILLYKIQEDK